VFKNKMNKKKILLHGAFFGSNYGDVLFCEIFREEIKKYEKPILGKAGKYIKKRLKIKNICNNELINFFSCYSIVFSPGGYFGEPNKAGLPLAYWRARMLLRHAYLGVLSRVFNKPYVIIGIGVGPINFKLGQCLIKYIFNGARDVTVRDEESYNYLRSMGVNNTNILISVDPIFCMKDKLLDKSSKKKIKALKDNNKKILLLHITSGGENGLAVCRAVYRFIKENDSYKLLLCTDFDMSKPNSYIDKTKNVFNENDYIFLKYTPELLSAVINESDLVVTSKLHVGIVGVSFGKSVLSFPVHNKTLRFYRQIGASERCVPIKEITENKAFNMLNKFADQTIKVDNYILEMSKLNFLTLKRFIESI
jgi:polysaccharide pyruvyl transferase WcaK-like protein